MFGQERTFGFFAGHRRGRALRSFDHHGEKSEPLDLHERGGAISDIEDALHDFTVRRRAL
jgi:hypothetical protein